ncbi:MAG TPA: Gfo/Idh/MocA family oxidoreductase [Candidatus Mcinerneyibacteriales bacterium]|mgnify:FL=1|nr:Gfo/Idh/MocA family oxidoreductase [Candidatus Mcinerneyibacteriales bacterium]
MTIKMGLIGCGRISKNHFETIKNLGTAVQLTAVCDIIEERAKAAAAPFHVPFYTDYKTMLDNETMDMVSICTPSGLHPAMGIEAAKRGIHVLSEKPMAVRLEDAEALIRACDHHGVHLFVVKQNRLNPGVAGLKKAVDENRFGKIYFLNSTVFWTRPQDYYDMAPWRGTWEFDGGCFMNQASHYVDLIQWIGGPVESDMGQTATLARKIEAEDTGAAVLRFRSGAMGVIQVTMLTYPRNLEGSLTVIGEKGTVRIGGMALNTVEKWEFSDSRPEDKAILESNYTPPNVYGFGHLQYYENVLQVLTGKAAPSTDGRSGKKSLELILAIYQSNMENRSVSLPLNYPR